MSFTPLSAARMIEFRAIITHKTQKLLFDVDVFEILNTLDAAAAEIERLNAIVDEVCSICVEHRDRGDGQVSAWFSVRMDVKTPLLAAELKRREESH